MNYISLCLEGSRTSEFEPSDRKDIMYCLSNHNNKVTTESYYNARGNGGEQGELYHYYCNKCDIAFMEFYPFE